MLAGKPKIQKFVSLPTISGENFSNWIDDNQGSFCHFFTNLLSKRVHDSLTSKKKPKKYYNKSMWHHIERQTYCITSFDEYNINYDNPWVN